MSKVNLMEGLGDAKKLSRIGSRANCPHQHSGVAARAQVRNLSRNVPRRQVTIPRNLSSRARFRKLWRVCYLSLDGGLRGGLDRVDGTRRHTSVSKRAAPPSSLAGGHVRLGIQPRAG